MTLVVECHSHRSIYSLFIRLGEWNFITSTCASTCTYDPRLAFLSARFLSLAWSKETPLGLVGIRSTRERRAAMKDQSQLYLRLVSL